MSSNDTSEGNGKCLLIIREHELSSESQKVKKKSTDSPEAKENVYTSKKISNKTTKQFTQGIEDKDKRYVYSSTEEDKEANSTCNKTKQSSLHVRYWTYLFDNLHRSIDEIFCACESEENMSGCQVCEIDLYYYKVNYAVLGIVLDYIIMKTIYC